MTRPAVILYGPPASGKDTITQALHRLDGCYRLYERLKVGTGRRDGYRAAAPAELQELRSAGDVLYENTRYGNTYAVISNHLDEAFRQGHVPILHLGQVAGVRAVKRFDADWLSISLECARHTASERLKARGSRDVEERLAAWDETEDDYGSADVGDFDMSIVTDTTEPADAAAAIHATMNTTTLRRTP